MMERYSKCCERQCAFAAAILDPDRSIPAGLVGPDGEPSAKRFAVYRNNVVAGLIDVLKAAYPATLRLVGDEFFAAMARVYVARELPESPIMLCYGAGFAGFLEAFEPVRGLPYLPDVARLERAWVEAYHEAEAGPLEPALFLGTDPERLAHAELLLHPSIRITQSSFPAVTIWQMNVDGGVSQALDIRSGGEAALIVRPGADVEVRRLPAGAAAFIRALLTGMPVDEAACLAVDDHPDFDLAGAMSGLFETQAIVGWKLSKETTFFVTEGSAWV